MLLSNLGGGGASYVIKATHAHQHASMAWWNAHWKGDACTWQDFAALLCFFMPLVTSCCRAPAGMMACLGRSRLPICCPSCPNSSIVVAANSRIDSTSEPKLFYCPNFNWFRPIIPTEQRNRLASEWIKVGYLTNEIWPFSFSPVTCKTKITRERKRRNIGINE